MAGKNFITSLKTVTALAVAFSWTMRMLDEEPPESVALSCWPDAKGTMILV